VVVATVVNWDFSKILQGPEAAWVGDYFYVNWAVCCVVVHGGFCRLLCFERIVLTFLLFVLLIRPQTTILYFLSDLIWVARVPLCVKSPGVIIKVSVSFAPRRVWC